jgi:cation/acetate symporter
MAWLLPPERDIGVLKAPVRSTLLLLGMFVGVLLALALLERLGVDGGLTPVGVLGGAAATFVFAAFLSHSRRAVDFYVADRKTSAPFAGLAGAGAFAGLLAVGLAGGGFTSYTSFLETAAGLVVGFLLSAVLLGPRLRRFGAYSAGDYLAIRYGSAWVRLTWALVAFAVCFLLLVAHLEVAAPLFATVIGLSPTHALFAVAGVTVLLLLPGGMRSLTWTQAIQYFVILMACIVPACSLIVRGATGDIAVAREFGAVLSAALPVRGNAASNSSTALAFALAALGGASLPHLTMRAMTAASPRGAFMSMAWAAVYSMILVSAGLFLALLLGELGDWDAAGGLLQIAALFESLPAVLAGLVLAGVLAALFAIGAAALFAATGAVAHDICDEILDRRAPEGRRIIFARVTLILLAVAAAAFVPILSVEPAALFRWALALSAAGGLAPILVGFWWRRAIDIGAIAGMVAGFGFAGLAFVLEQTGLLGGVSAGGIASIGAPTAGLAGLALAVAVTVGVSIVMPEPEPDQMEEPTDRPGEALPIRERPA